MSDDDDRLIVFPHIAEDIEQLLRLLRSQDCGWFIKDQNIRLPVKHLDDLDCLLLRDSHIIDLLVRVHIKSVAVADLLDPFGSRFQIIFVFLQSENDILGSCHDVDQFEMLVDHTDPEVERILRRADRYLFPVYHDLSGIREINA